jgi:hypothetical protein
MSPLLYQLSYTATLCKQAVDYITVYSRRQTILLLVGAIHLWLSQSAVGLSSAQIPVKSFLLHADKGREERG